MAAGIIFGGWKNSFDVPTDGCRIPFPIIFFMFSNLLAGKLAMAAAAVALLISTPVHASSSSKAKKPAMKIDPVRLKAAASLYHKEEAAKPASGSLSSLGLHSSRYRYDSRMLRAAEIAASRAYAHSRGTCWRFVKNALVSAGVIDSRPTSAYAKQAAWELTRNYGFRKVTCSDPYKAPVGSLLVYGGRGAGHVEFRTKAGFVSDFSTSQPSKRPLIGVFVKP